MKTFIYLVSVFTLALLIGCASAGKNFRSESIKDIKIGKTYVSEIIVMFGEPFSKVLKSSGDLESTIYSYGYVREAGSAVNRRLLAVELVRDTVIGYDFESSFQEDNTDFKGDMRNSIIIGKTTRDNIISLVGQPTGKMAPKNNLLGGSYGTEAKSKINEKVRDIWVYCYSFSKRKEGVNMRQGKTLIIYFDSKGLVVDKYYSEVQE